MARRIPATPTATRMATPATATTTVVRLASAAVIAATIATGIIYLIVTLNAAISYYGTVYGRIDIHKAIRSF
jgi:hypothetical protein